MNKKRKYFLINGTPEAKQRRLQIKRDFVNLLGGKCVDCGFNQHLAALDFDHINPKEKKESISHLIIDFRAGEISWDVLEKEVKKCVVRCANCHRIKTWPTATI